VIIFLAQRRNRDIALSNSINPSGRGIGRLEVSQTSICAVVEVLSCQQPRLTGFFCSAQMCFGVGSSELWGREGAHQAALNFVHVFIPLLSSKYRAVF